MTAEEKERRLAAALAHAVRSPLSTMLMLTEALKAGTFGPMTHLQLQQVDVLHRSAIGISQVIADLLPNEQEWPKA